MAASSVVRSWCRAATTAAALAPAAPADGERLASFWRDAGVRRGAARLAFDARAFAEGAKAELEKVGRAVSEDGHECGSMSVGHTCTRTTGDTL